MDDNAQREVYINFTSGFISKVGSHIIGLDTGGMKMVETNLARISSYWATSTQGLAKLRNIDDTLRCIAEISAFVASVDIARIATSMDISDTSRGVLALNKRNILDFGVKYSETLHSIANNMLKKHAFTPVEVEDALIRAKFPLGPIWSKLARRYFLLLPEAVREHIARDIAIKTDKFLEVSHIAIKETAPIYEQVFTTGRLIPKTRAIGLCAIEAMLCASSPGCKFDVPTKGELMETLTRISERRKIMVIYISKNVARGARVIEFDGRVLFDKEYVASKGLRVGELSGLCVKYLQRYATINELDNSMASCGLYYAKVGTGSECLVIESLTPGAFRCLGLPRKMFIAPKHCQFLIDGQSNRAAQYHGICENAILSRRGSDKMRVVAASFRANASKTNACGNLMIRDALKLNITREMTQFFANDSYAQTHDLGHIFAFCAKNLRTLLPSLANRSIHRATLSMFYSQMMKLAWKIFALYILRDSQFSKARGPEHAHERDVLIAEIVKILDDEGYFVVSETLNMMYLRMI